MKKRAEINAPSQNNISKNKNLNDFKSKTTNVNILLNRVRQDQKKESRKKLLFSAAASAGVLLFSVLIF